ncbi:hypothetical protein EBT16_01105 [bacterium]|nr:hypothetical protein [bacterium]
MDNLSLRQKTRTALDKIDVIEDTINELVTGMNNVIQQLNGRLADVSEKLDALATLVGPEKFQEVLKANALAKTKAQADAAKKALEQHVASGDLVAATTVGTESLVVGREFDKDGNLLEPGRIQLTFSGIKKEFQDQLLGQTAGFTVTTPVGGKFEVLEIYDFVAKETPTVAPSAEVVDASATTDANTVTTETQG